MERLPFPHAEHIRAARDIFQRLTTWRSTNEMFGKLRDRFPDFESTSCLVKSVVLNSLYSTGIWKIHSVSEQLSKKLIARSISNGWDPGESEAVQFIDETSLFHFTEDVDDHRKCISFVSKFSHFFVNENRFRIYDSIAREMLKAHLGKNEYDPEDSYKKFCINFEKFRRGASLAGDVTLREIDQYLWIQGNFRRFKCNKRDNDKRRVNSEAKAFFDANSSDNQLRLLEEMLLPLPTDRT